MVGALLLLALVLGPPGPFALVNGTGAPVTDLSIRPADGKQGWRSLGAGPVPAGDRLSLPAPAGDLCAFDVRASQSGTTLVWPSVNLCDVRSVTLRRRPDGILWVDYD